MSTPSDQGAGPAFVRQRLAGASFEQVDLSGARFRLVNLSGTRFEQVAINGAVMRGVVLEDVDIDGDVSGLRINGVEVAPLIEAELDRRDPDHAMMRPKDSDGFREAWDIIERRWADTVARAQRLDADLLHESVDGEWSFIQTLRHLVFATDAWVRRAVLGEPDPWDPLDLPHDTFEPIAGVPRDLDTRPSLDEVMALRTDRMATVRQVIHDLTDERLDESTVPVPGPGYPEAQSFPVRVCLSIVLSEEWHHRSYADRDLETLEAGVAAPGKDESARR